MLYLQKRCLLLLPKGDQSRSIRHVYQYTGVLFHADSVLSWTLFVMLSPLGITYLTNENLHKHRQIISPPESMETPLCRRGCETTTLSLQ